MNARPLARGNDIVIQNIEDEVLVYDLTENRAICLNKTSAEIWQLCDGNRNINKIAVELSKKYKKVVMEDLIWLALEQLKQENLLTDAEGFESRFAGLSRRELIRKLGFASMIALPVISSIAAPGMANAASCAGPGAMVTSAPPSSQANVDECFNYCNRFAADQCCTGDGSGTNNFDDGTGICSCSNSTCSP